MAMNEPRLNLPELSVSELSASLKRTVEDSYGYVRVRGEVSGYRGPHASGHAYFALKDESAKIDAVIWRGSFGRMRIKPEEGLEVIVTGRLTTYPSRSSYQIIVETLEPSGLGALMALLEERKQRLAAEGLFDEARKQLLPVLPTIIGVVTSPSGAVIRDILHRLADRFPRHVLLWPVKVQGEGSAAEIAAAITGFNALPPALPSAASGGGTGGGLPPRPDLIIVARGGGSLEDLWSFNEEIVVRAAAESFIPLISAVGHETDVTLIDFAADRRAPTPTAAAEMAVPVRAELLLDVDSLARRALACWRRNQDARRTELRAAARALPSADGLLALPRQRLDHGAARLPRALFTNTQSHHVHYSRVGPRLNARLLAGHVEHRRERFVGIAHRLRAGLAANIQAYRTRIVRGNDRVKVLADRATRALDVGLDRHAARLDRAAGLLAAFSYRGVLARGFALVRDDGGRPVRTAGAVSAGMRLDIEFSDGRVGAVAGDARMTPAETAPAPVRRRRRRSDGGEGQGSLF